MSPKLFRRALPCRRAKVFSAVGCFVVALLAAASVQAAPEHSNVITLKVLGGSGEGTGARGDLIVGTDGNFYGTTYGGGANGAGTVYQLTPGGTMTVLHSFAGGASDGTGPYAGVTQGPDGTLYGTTYFGGANSAGTVYKVTTSGTFTNLHSFSGTSPSGFFPYAGVTLAPDGNLYGTTLRGGANDAGVVFKTTPDGTTTTLVSFNSTNGRAPEGRMIVGADGALYGTTLDGGAGGRGAIFKMSTSGDLSVVYSFPALGAFNDRSVATNATGANPRSGLIIGADGNFYGTTYQGGTGGFGTVYRMTPGGTVSVLHAFTGPPGDGAGPLAAPVQLADGSFAGTTERGGGRGVGTAWLIRPSGEYRLLHSFTGEVTDGGTIQAGLATLNGQLFGVSSTDSIVGSGLLFRIDTDVAGTLPVAFSIAPDEIMIGAAGTLTWSAPGSSQCSASGNWADTIGISGSKTITPTSPGIYTYVLTCTDANSQVRNAYAYQVVNAPPLQPVDGGASGGGGALRWLELAALALLLATTTIPGLKGRSFK